MFRRRTVTDSNLSRVAFGRRVPRCDFVQIREDVTQLNKVAVMPVNSARAQSELTGPAAKPATVVPLKSPEGCVKN